MKPSKKDLEKKVVAEGAVADQPEDVAGLAVVVVEVVAAEAVADKV